MLKFFITDETRLDSLQTCNNLPEGCFVVFRDYDHPDRLAFGKKIKSVCEERNLTFLVGKDYSLACELDADGMHFPEFMISEISKIKSMQPKWIITAASHGEKAIINAKNAGADYIFLSLLFSSDSHPAIKPFGIIPAGKLAIKYNNIVGLGGIKPEHVKMLENYGFVGFAGVSIFKM